MEKLINYLTPPIMSHKLPQYHAYSKLPEGPSMFGEKSGAEKLAEQSDETRQKARKLFRYTDGKRTE